MLDYLVGIAVWLSQGINAVFMAGNPDMTLSARCYVNRFKPGWRTARKVINALFFWQDDHCKASYRSDLDFAVTVLAEQVNHDA